MPAVNLIDEEILRVLRNANIPPSQISSDEEFLRRVTLTTTGQLPSADDVRGFLADSDYDKRARKIDELLAHPLHAAMWATRFCEMTGNDVASLEGPDQLKPKRAKMWHDWLRRRFSANTPYDQLVRGVLTATSRAEGESASDWIDREAALIHAARESFDAAYAERPSLDLFWRRSAAGQDYPIEELAERVASSFMGVRIGCAKCHAHPFDRWTQQDYRAFANIFSQVRFDLSPELRQAVADRLEKRRSQRAAGEGAAPPLPRLSEVYLSEASIVLRDKATGEPLPVRPLGGPILEIPANSGTGTIDLRVQLMDWLNEPANPYFARNIVNRAWAMHFGRGLVEPLDGISTSHAPTHARLLDELAEDFVDHGYDLRRLERLILTSTTWQLSSIPNDGNRADHEHFARAHVRMPAPHVMVDMWHAAVGLPADLGADVPRELRAVEIAPSRLTGTPWDRLLELFGRAARTQPCECTPAPGPSIRQTLALLCDSSLMDRLPHGRVQSLCDLELSDAEVVEELFLSTVSRFPTDAERQTATSHLAEAADRKSACVDLLWSLMNIQEFVTIH
jgi:hypothetical protein